MTYEKFKEEILNALRNKLNDSITVNLVQRNKMNDQQKTGVEFEIPDSNTTPIIYLEEYYQMYECDITTLDNIVADILDVFHQLPDLNIDAPILGSFDDIKDGITMKLINTAQNSSLLEKIPHIPFADLSIIYLYILKQDEYGTYSTLIDNKAFKAWGIDTMTLHQYALANYNRLLPIEFINLKDYIREKIMSGAITGPDSKKILLSLSVPQSNNYLYLLSNKWAFAGAALISCKNVMDAIADFLGEDYYIIPSSVSEVLIIPESKTPSQEIWNLAIQEINESTLNPEEYLSDHTYFYSKSGKDSIPCFGEIPSPDPIQGSE